MEIKMLQSLMKRKSGQPRIKSKTEFNAPQVTDFSVQCCPIHFSESGVLVVEEMKYSLESPEKQNCLVSLY